MKQLSLKKAAMIALSSCLLILPLTACFPQGTASAGTETEPVQSTVLAEESASASEQTEAADGKSSASKKKQRADGTESGEKPEKKESGTSSSSGRRSRPSGTESSSDAEDSGQKSKEASGRSSAGKSSSGRSSSGKKASGKSGSGKKTNTTAKGSAVRSLSDGETLSGGTYTAEKADESAIDASGSVTASVSGAAIRKTAGDASSASASSFQGVNAGVRVYDSATVTLKDCVIESSASNATGVFAYDKGTVYLNDSAVTVTGSGSGGIQVAGGGSIYGSNLTVTSADKAAIRSDKGGGTIVLDGGTYTSTGTNGCPAIYSTADITVSNAECVSSNSRAVIIEGKNSVTLENCVLSGNDQSTKTGSVKANVLLYQSASGDAAEGTSVFTMHGGSMTALSGAMFYCTNTSSVINLHSAELILSEDGTLLTVSAGRWGKDGKNGGNCTLNASDQTLSGTVSVDKVSSLSMRLTNTVFTGSVQSTGTTSVYLEAGSTWKLTADSYVTSIDGDLSGLDLNGFTLYVNGTAFTA